MAYVQVTWDRVTDTYTQSYTFVTSFDLTRALKKGLNLSSDTSRETLIVAQVTPDTLRSLRVLTSFDGDSARFIFISGEVTRIDLQRIIIVDIRTTPDTARKLAGIIECDLDTFRKVIDIFIQKGSTYLIKDIKPVYFFNELGSNYTFTEKALAYTLKELLEGYEWKGLNSMYQFRLGEEKEVGVEVLAKDGSTYIISGQWQYGGQSGSANIDNHKVFTMLKPDSVGSKKCIFTVTITPSGNSEEQTLICPVTVNVVNN